MKLPEKILYAHEHTTIDLSGPKKNIDCRLDDFDATAAEYRRLAEHGVVGIIDQTNRGMGRNVAYVQKMAAQAGVEITHATGYYKEPFLPPECYTLTEQQLCDIMVKELTEGIEGTGVRATVIGEIGTSKDITETEAKVFRAASRAHAETGAPICTHTTLGTRGLEQLEIFKSFGVDLSRVVLSHIDLSADLDYMKRLLDQGVNIAFDTIGKCNYQPDVSRADWLSRLCAEGYDTQIVMSMDITRRSNFADRGGVGYSYLLDTFAPLASEAGVPDRAWENLLYRNALRIYKGQKYQGFEELTMKTYPLHSISLEQAKQLQFKVIDAVTRNFQGEEVLSLGDLGVVKGLNKPRCTVKVEKVFADTFDAPAALLVRGSGTGAIRWALTACLKPGDAILVHTSPIYTTTQVTIDAMGLKPIRADFNDLEQLKAVCAQHKDEIRGALVQLTRQKPEDRYDYKAVIAAIKAALPGIPVVTDDNYAALKVDAIGCQAGADLSTFSCFKILGPEGVGAVIGSKELINRIYKMQYSGGSQVQGHEAMEALRGLIYAPVALAIQSEVNEELVRRLNAGEIPHVRQAFLANAQSKVLLVEFDQEIAEKILDAAPKFGAAPHPVGSESKYEFAPMIYRVSGTFRAQDPTIEHRMIRINPMRSGPDTIIRILRSCMEQVEEN